MHHINLELELTDSVFCLKKLKRDKGFLTKYFENNESFRPFRDHFRPFFKNGQGHRGKYNKSRDVKSNDVRRSKFLFKESP